MDFSHQDLAVLVPHGQPFERPGWTFEIKHDGVRAAAVRCAAGIRLFTRNGNSLAEAFPDVAERLLELPVGTVLDAELVVLDQYGRSDFAAGSRRLHCSRPTSVRSARANWPATLIAFDLLAFSGSDLRTAPLKERKALLEEHIAAGPHLLPLLGVEQGRWLFEQAGLLGLEGVVAKRLDGTYRAGRGAGWLKIKTAAGQNTARARARSFRRSATHG